MSKVVVKKNTVGHNCSVTGWQGSTPYLYPKKGPVDGIGRQHIKLYATCDVCNKEFLVAKMHSNVEGKIFENNQ
jgi:hypothetical protein